MKTILVQRVLVTTDLPPWDLQLRSDPPSYALGATTYYVPIYSYLLGRSLTVIFVFFSLRWFTTISLHDAVPIFYFRSHRGQLVGRLVSSHSGVRFDVLYLDLLTPLLLDFSVCVPWSRC